MKCLQLKHKIYRLLVILLSLIQLFVANSCNKDEKSVYKPIVDPTVADAKIWYEDTFQKNSSINLLSRSLDRSAVKNGQSAGNADLSQIIKPDWQHPDSYIRFNKNVIELPIDPNTNFSADLKNATTNQIYADQKYSRTSFLIFRQGKSYSAYVMITMANPSYVKGDMSKLSKNSFRQHDADFTGVVVYFTPNGKYVSGYTYRNGKLLSSSAAIQTTTTQSKSLNRGIKHPTRTNLDSYDDCTDWYIDYILNGTVIYSDYIGTTCDNAGGGGGGGGGNTGTGGLSGNDPGLPPASCDLSTGGSGYIPPSDGSGFPDPTTVCSAGDTTPDFGEDDPSECLNCRVLDDNFADLIQYVQGLGFTVYSPFSTTLTVNGVQYAGQVTEIYNTSGQLVASYFTPYANSDTFEVGTEYSIGNSTGASGSTGTSVGTGVDFGNTSYLATNGSPIIYTPDGGGSGSIPAPLTTSQKQALESADDARILNLLQQQDAQDDAGSFPCHGTGRSGNVAWPGTKEHWLIQVDYLIRNPGALKEYIIPGASSQQNGNPGFADIVNTITNEMFEIKPNNTAGQNAGIAEIQIYVAEANASCPRNNGGPWFPGSNYTTRYLLDPTNPNNVLIATLFTNGVIVYSSLSRQTVPVPVPSPVTLPKNLADKLNTLLRQIIASPSSMQLQIISFLRQNPQIVPYLKAAAVAIVIGTIMEDIATEGLGVADDWESFVIARTLWNLSNTIVLY